MSRLVSAGALLAALLVVTTAWATARTMSIPGRIAFSAGPHPDQDIYVVRADGSGLRRLTSAHAAEFDPTWSPEGKRIAYRRQTAGDSTAEIYVMNADGSRQRNLTRRRGQDHSPSWSPDGTTIAFASVRGGSLPSIWLMSADGSHQRRLSTVDGEYPAWSPDGRKIAFDRNTLGPTGWDIWVVDAGGSHQRPLLHSRADEKGAAWSPDGRWIVFTSSPQGAALEQLWIARADGSRRRRLSSMPAERPDWSPDGRWIVVTAGQLAIVRADGRGWRTVATGAAGQVALADWGR